MALIKNIKDKIESKEEVEKIEQIIKETAKEVEREKPAEKGWEMGKKEKQPEKLLSPEGEAMGQEMAGFSVSPVARQERKEREKRIEKILEENMEEIYLKLSLEKQKEFRVTGEQTARQINAILEKTKFKIKEIINLIRKWLSIIPGLNKFFLEQEAKIKADKIINLKNNRYSKTKI
jgi:hypothetical protein